MEPGAVGGLDRHRHERKLAMDPGAADAIESALSDRFNVAACAEFRVCTLYLELPDGRLGRAALLAPGDCLKVRIREYDPDWGRPARPRCVVELKQQRDELSHKQRFWLPRAALWPLFRGPLSQLLPFGPPGLSARAALRAVGGAEHLRPLVAVCYRRKVLQMASELRITFDRELTFHRAADSVLLGPASLQPALLGAPYARETRTVVELKSRSAAIPEWAGALAGARADAFSKFAQALRALPHSPKRAGSRL